MVRRLTGPKIARNVLGIEIASCARALSVWQQHLNQTSPVHHPKSCIFYRSVEIDVVRAGKVLNLRQVTGRSTKLSIANQAVDVLLYSGGFFLWRLHTRGGVRFL
ncbi:hypothetical protein R1flu_018307 [Riccia fluitans]|uniref:Uncharacterized protein n=1 Tax=Riccia fluitans TaxID=41844 RepID=A0ABD1ZJD6_9MARC